MFKHLLLNFAPKQTCFFHFTRDIRGINICIFHSLNVRLKSRRPQSPSLSLIDIYIPPVRCLFIFLFPQSTMASGEPFGTAIAMLQPSGREVNTNIVTESRPQRNLHIRPEQIHIFARSISPLISRMTFPGDPLTISAAFPDTYENSQCWISRPLCVGLYEGQRRVRRWEGC